MSGYYPVGSMLGSGIYDEDRPVVVQCDEPVDKTSMDPADGVCDFDDEVDARFRGTLAYWTCPKCGAEHETETGSDW